MAGVRLALAAGWTSLLAVELLASSEGIGYLMVWARQLFMLDIVFVCIVVIGLIGVAMDRGIGLLDRRLVHWPHPATAHITRGPRYQAGSACNRGCCRWACWRSGNTPMISSGSTRIF